MGKKLIIKGADFSENGIHEEIVTLDVSALYNRSNVQITAENLSSQTNADKLIFITGGSNAVVETTGNHSINYFGSKVEVGDYQTLVVNFANMPGSHPGTKWSFGVCFANSSNRTIKAYAADTSEASGDWVVKVPSNFSGEIPIPNNAVYAYICDTIADTTALSTHSAVLKKVVIE